jgi:hypothetical protein
MIQELKAEIFKFGQEKMLPNALQSQASPEPFTLNQYGGNKANGRITPGCMTLNSNVTFPLSS